MTAAEREAQEVREHIARNLDHLTADDMRDGLLVSFEHRGNVRVGKVAKWGRTGATVVSGWFYRLQEPKPSRRRIPMEYQVSFTALKAAAWPGSTVVTRHGHTLFVQGVRGREVEGIVTTEGDIAYGQPGSIPATEIVAVHDDNKTWGAA